jgi:alpha-tubulin suppressor-like RCC1 family protein
MATAGHNCAKLSDASTKCWGLNGWGQIGLNAGNSLPPDEAAKTVCTAAPTDCIGDTAGEMGDALPAAITAGNTSRITVGFRHSCALLVSGTLTCWGSNEQAQVGIGDILGNNSIIGDQPGEMAAVLPTALKPGKIVEEITAAGFHTCVWNTDDTLNCWGHNSDGQLGRNDLETWGDGPNEMGAGLIDVDLGS